MTEQTAAFHSYPYLDRLVADFNARQSLASVSEPVVEGVTRWHVYERAAGIPGTCLFFYGNHVFELGAQISEMRTEFDSWCDQTIGMKRMIRCEGRVPEISLEADEDMCVSSERGEIALLAYWARKNNIPIFSLECDVATQSAEMFKPEHGSHSRDELFYYYVARQLPQGLESLRLGQVTPQEYVYALECMQAYLLATIERFSEEFGWSEFDFSYDNFARIHDRLYPLTPLDVLNNAFFRQETMTHMYQPTSAIQFVAYSVNLHRDEFASNLLTQDMAQGRQVFAAMGGLHVRNMNSLGSHYLRFQ